MTEYTNGESAYTDNSPFVRALRTEGQVRVIAALLVNPAEEQTVSRLKEKTGMARSTVLDNLEMLQNMGLVAQTGRIGGADLYRVTDHNALPHLRKAQMALITDEESRTGAPEPEKHEDQEVLNNSFGEPPEVDPDEPEDIEIGAGN